jgi:predicted nucleotidyltransferase
MKYTDIQALAERYHILLLYLFGSQAERGKRYLEGENMTPDATSDLDVAIVLDKPFSENIETYGILFRDFSEIFDPFILDLIYMREVNPLFQYEIIKGIRIYARDESYADDFEERIMKMAEDLFFKKRIFNNEIMEAIEDGYFEFEYRPNP